MNARHITRLPLIAAAACVMLAGCGQMQESADKAADEAFDREFTAACTSTSTAQGIPAELADEFCACTLEKVNEKYSGMDKAQLGEADLVPMSAQCMERLVGENG